MALDGKALTAVGVGSLLVWSGIKGWSIVQTIGDVITGVKPSGGTTIPLTTGDSPAGSAVGGSGENVARVALQYVGHAYKFGGAPGLEAQNPWDCSSFVNYVIGVKFNAAIPGNKPGQYRGQSHGPPTGMWGVWSGLRRLQRSEVSAGDIIVWTGHMGIAIDNTQMVNAINPKRGTVVTAIDRSSNGPLMIYGRLTWANPSAV